MPVSVNPQDIPDLVNLTYNKMLKNKTWNDLSLSKQFHTVVDRFFKGKKLPMKSGPQLTWKIQVANQNNFRWSGLFDPDTYGVRTDLTSGGVQYWGKCTTNYSFDIHEPDFQSNEPDVLVDNILVREHSMYSDWFENIERAFWTAPSAPPSGNQPGTLCGIPFWLQSHATTGFNGGNPTGFSSGAGNIDSAVVPMWRNWTDTYKSISRDDFIAKMRKACRRCKFQAPHTYKTSKDGDPRYVLYTTEAVVENSAKYLDSKADNIRDMDGVGDATFKSMPIEWVPALDDDTDTTYDSTNPLFGVDWSSFKLVFNSGRDMVRTEPYRNTELGHTVYSVAMDSIMQLVTDDRRSSFRLNN